MYARCEILCWLYLERIWCHRVVDELQRVGWVVLVQGDLLLINLLRLVELIVLNVGLSAGILSPVKALEVLMDTVHH